MTLAPTSAGHTLPDVAALRARVERGETRSEHWRRDQLGALRHLLERHEDAILEAIVFSCVDEREATSKSASPASSSSNGANGHHIRHFHSDAHSMISLIEDDIDTMIANSSDGEEARSIVGHLDEAILKEGGRSGILRNRRSRTSISFSPPAHHATGTEPYVQTGRPIYRQGAAKDPFVNRSSQGRALSVNRARILTCLHMGQLERPVYKWGALFIDGSRFHMGRNIHMFITYVYCLNPYPVLIRPTVSIISAR